jgi:long-chain acyl-CoA synthetase
MGRVELKNVVFLTGATGFLGTQIIRRLIKKENICVIVLVRGQNFEDAHRHLRRTWWEWPDLMEKIVGQKKFKTGDLNENKIYILNGDISKEGLGLENEEYNYLVDNLTYIIHAAADIRLNVPIDDLRKINVTGTKNLVRLASAVHKNHGILRFSHLSTAYVAGGQDGLISENTLSDDYGFLSNYEQSKYEGELIVKESGLPISIFRPGMVVGDSTSGYVKTFNTIYVLLRLYLNKMLLLIPVSEDSKINLVPVDYVADSVVELTLDENAEGFTFHLTAPYSSLPNVKEFINFIQQWANDNLGLKLQKPLFLPSSFIPYISFFLKYTNNGKRLSKTIKELQPYLNEDREFSRTNLENLLGPYNLNWKKFLPEILKYAVYNGFFHRSERTVHEQILFRLKSTSRPVNYYDIINSKFKKTEPSDIRINIINAVKSLKALGVGPGDRVAIIGYNNTRYLTLDVSIGLLGAVSVPVYYTSPMSEINDILNDSGAKVIFIGTPQLLEHLMDFENEQTIISFYNDSFEHSSDILSWQEFLGVGEEFEDVENSDEEIIAPVDFNDIATIRYTSGTTGKPSGVIFNHGNLRWMAEYIASMPPWHDRTRQVSYLSFLPMNHVVEGILGIYSPYYAPTSLKLYFLEDFQDLEATLPKVRPTIFFSVPRFYEKVWSKIQKSWLGSMYLKVNEGIVKNMLRKILRRTILKQTGLDACAQLIVGSAPISIDLLMSYQELGIQIHNAYGLTEAPLVTINRLGSNRLGTVGEPLPATDVKILDDGEVAVRGPQVTSGYFNDKTRNDLLFQDNWLLTGDYGYITTDGSLVITGRKKELIVNSYGKSISPLKIEGMLKHIDGVSEVMVVGDEKPYCISLIWVDEDIDPDEISISIKDINSKLSNPEKIKRWAILKNDLSIENGDLTANLKLKRENILKRHQDLLKLIYNDKCRQKLRENKQDLNLININGEGKTNEY